MPNFKVTAERGFWDGTRRHPAGTIIALEPADYKRFLSVTFEGMDKDAQAAVAKLRKEKKLPEAVAPEPVRDGYDPHKREELLEFARESGVKVIEAAPPPEQKAVRPETVVR